MDYTAIKFWSLIPDKNKKCKICDCPLTPEIADVHHIDHDRSNNKPENLALLCQMCHRGTSDPRLPSKIVFNFRMSEKLLKTIKDDAKSKSVTMTHVIISILEKHYKIEFISRHKVV